MVDLHQNKPPILHRDLSPGNVLIKDETWDPLISDFGVSKLLEARGNTFELITKHKQAGTFRYMSPEAFDPDAQHKRGIDCWAYGIILNELLSGELPYSKCKNEHQVLAQLMLGCGPVIAP